MVWPDIIRENLGWKLLALLLATALWFTVSGAIRGEPRVPPSLTPVSRTFRHVPITVMTVAAETRRFRVDPQEVEVVVSGDAEALAQLKAGEIEVYVNLSDVKDAQSLRKRIRVYTPVGVALVRVVPAYVDVETGAAVDREKDPLNKL